MTTRYQQPWYQQPPALQPDADAAPNAIVIGAGFAGCSIASTLASRGWDITLLEAGNCVASGASGNRRCIIKPHQSRDDSLHNHFWSDAFLYTRETLLRLASKTHIEKSFAGVLQLQQQAGRWATGNSGARVTDTYASTLAGIPIAGEAIYFPLAGWVNGSHYCRALLETNQRINVIPKTKVLRIHTRDRQWRVDTQQTTDKTHCTTEDSVATATYTADALIVAAGASLSDILAPVVSNTVLPLRRMLGHTVECKLTRGDELSSRVVTGKGYVIPDNGSCTVGASHIGLTDRASPDVEHGSEHGAEYGSEFHSKSGTGATDDLATRGLHDIFTKANRLSVGLSDRLSTQSVWQGTRLTTPDRLPVVGAVPDYDRYSTDYARLHHGPAHQPWPDPRYHHGLYLLGGLGSRGAVSAALAAELLADVITGNTPKDTPDRTANRQRYLELMHPARFLIRQLRKQR